MATTSGPGKKAREDREKMLILKHRMDNRITTTRHGKEFLDSGDYANALKKFSEYMDTMAEAKKVPDMFSLKISDFNPNRDTTEMLLISHIYFEMARIYDAVPKFSEQAKKCLEQFVHFSANQPYQVVNSELIRKHLKKSLFKNPDFFRSAYEQIYVQSKKCYIVTFCYGNDHELTQEFRAFKELLLDYQIGRELVRLYYLYSSTAVTKWENSAQMKIVARVFIRPTLLLFSKTILPLILPKC